MIEFSGLRFTAELAAATESPPVLPAAAAEAIAALKDPDHGAGRIADVVSTEP